MKASLGLVLAVVAVAHAASPSIKWSKCDGIKSDVIDCGTINVPLNHEKPQGEMIELGMSRLKCNGTECLGSLFFNNGGPGGIASLYPLAYTPDNPVFNTPLHEHYDIIGLDPRGVGLSTRVKCDPDIWNERITTIADTKEKWDALIDHNKRLGESCKRLTGDLINHLDTISVIQDFDIVRQAVKEDKLNFLGLSYGTFTGAMYAEMFPEHTGRMVLDGVLDHSQSKTSTLTASITTYEYTLNRFFEWCNSTSACAWKDRNQPVLFDKLVAKANDKPIPAPGCKAEGSICQPDMNGEELLYLVQNWLGVKSPKNWPEQNWNVLSHGLEAALNGNATILSPILAQGKSSELFPTLGPLCQDWYPNENHIETLYQLQLSANLAPHTKGISESFRSRTRCAGWPAPVKIPSRYLDQKAMKKAGPAFMVHSTHDPSCSLIWATGLREQWPGSLLAERVGDGHTSYFLWGETSRAMDRFLITGKLPPHGTMYKS